MASDGDDRRRRGRRARREADIGDERWFALGGAPDAGGQAQRLYLYEMTGSELPIADFRGEFRIREGRPHRCTVIWTGQFTVTSDEEKTVSDRVRAFFRTGARAIEKQYAAGPVSSLRRRTRTLQRRR